MIISLVLLQLHLNDLQGNLMSRRSKLIGLMAGVTWVGHVGWSRGLFDLKVICRINKQFRQHLKLLAEVPFPMLERWSYSAGKRMEWERWKGKEGTRENMK